MAGVFGLLIDCVQHLQKNAQLFRRDILHQPGIKIRLPGSPLVFQLVRLLQREKLFPALVLRVGFPADIPFGFEARDTVGGGALFHPQLPADFKEDDPRFFADAVEDVILAGAEAEGLQLPLAEIGGVAGNFGDFALAGVHNRLSFPGKDCCAYG